MQRVLFPGVGDPMTLAAITPGQAALLFFGGIIAGVVNAVAGGGSAITLPILTEITDATIANGTNRIAIMIGALASVSGYQQGDSVPWRRTLPLIPPAFVGAVTGAYLASQTSPGSMKKAFAIVLFIVAGSVLVKPSRWITQSERRLSQPWSSLLMFAIGLYGGFVQAGVGFFLLAGLVFGGGLDLVRANAAKMVLVASYTWVALLIFVLAGQVDFGLGLILAAGNSIGAYSSSRLAVRKGANWIRWFLIVAAVGAAIRMLLT